MFEVSSCMFSLQLPMPVSSDLGEVQGRSWQHVTNYLTYDTVDESLHCCVLSGC